MTIFGQILDASHVERTFKAFLDRWMPVYLAEVARQNSLPPNSWLFQRPDGSWGWIRGWQAGPRFELDENTQLPAGRMIVAGVAGRPTKEGDGTYRATWTVGMAIVVSAKDQASTDALAKRMGAAIRALVVQHPSLEDSNVEGTSWEDEGYDDVPPEQGRNLASARLVFNVEYNYVVSALDGPVLPSDPPVDPTVPYADWPTVRDPNAAPTYQPATVTRETL